MTKHPGSHPRLGSRACRGRLRTECPGHGRCSCCGHPKEIGIPACAGMTEERRNHEAHRLIRDSVQRRTEESCEPSALARLVLLLRSPEGDRDSCLRRNDGRAAGITKHPGSSATRCNGVTRKAANRAPWARLVLLLRSPEGDRDSCLRRNDGSAPAWTEARRLGRKRAGCDGEWSCPRASAQRDIPALGAIFDDQVDVLRQDGAVLRELDCV